MKTKRQQKALPLTTVAREDGTREYPGPADTWRTVPEYAPRPGYSVADVARALGGRLFVDGDYVDLDIFASVQTDGGPEPVVK